MPRGVVYRRATPVTITLWVITVTIKVVLDTIESAETHTFTVGPIWLAMSTTLAVQQYVMLNRAESLAPARTARSCCSEHPRRMPIPCGTSASVR